MNDPALGLCVTVATVACVVTASITDLRRRRIPNWLTFPAMGAGWVLWATFLGWKGFVFSVGGTFAASLLLVLLHLGRGPGMGDIKLAAAVGSLLGPRLSPIAMLLAGVGGGFIALCCQLRSGGPLADALSPFLVGVPRFERWVARDSAPGGSPAQTIPYAIAIGLGSMVVLAVFWCTEGQGWLR
jgi:prepilin peptidase CpaA